MCLLFETIKLKDGVFFNLPYHFNRMNASRKILFRTETCILPETLLTVPVSCQQGIFKCRVVYDHYIHSIEFVPYAARKIKTLQIIHDDNIKYPFKFADRSNFQNLKSKVNADEIIIVKKGWLTDTSFSNIVFYDGNKWLTPASPLLNGTKRQELLEKGIIYEKKIRIGDLKNYSKVRLINAMLDFENSNEIEMMKVLL